MSTKIEWCDETLNVVTGCTPIGAGCDNCYAMNMFKRRGKAWGYGPEPTFHPKRFEKLNKYPDGSRVFINSMGDLFHRDVPDKWISSVFGHIGAYPRLTFIILTKRPKRMMEWMMHSGRKVRPNLHLYVSAWNQESLDHNVGYLLQTPAAVRGVSIEPMLGPTSLAGAHGRWSNIRPSNPRPS